MTIPNINVNGHEIEVTLSDHSCSFKIKNSVYGVPTFSIIKFPTGNCQLSSIAYLANLLMVTTDKDTVLAILKECFARTVCSHLILIDVREEWAEHVEKIFNVIHKYPYRSTNFSNMCLFMVTLT